MKTISPALQAHIAQSTATLARCWKVTRKDGTILGFTSNQEDLVVSGVTYTAGTGFTPSAMSAEAALSVGNMNVQGFLSSPAITDADVFAGKWDFATVEIFIVNYKDLTMGTLPMNKGTLGEVKTGRVAFEAELRGLAQKLQQVIGRVYGPDCDVEVLGDTRCTVALGPFTFAGAVTGVVSQRTFLDTSMLQATGYFDRGKITWTSGLNNGFVMDLKRFTLGGTFDLFLPTPYAIGIGDTYSAIAGCDRKLTTCVTKFNNVINFRGFPFVPGYDWMISGKQ